MIFAHPLDQPGGLPFSPFFFGCAGAVILWIVLLWRDSSTGTSAPLDRPFGAWEGELTRPQWVTRGIAIALLFLSIAAARLGSDLELDNLTPAFVVGLLWPLSFLACVLFGAVWRWLDQWDALARLSATDLDESEEAGTERSVEWAGMTAFAVACYFYAYDKTLAPRSIGIALAVYTIAVLAGCLAFGRRSFMGRVEAIGLCLSWVARMRQGGLQGWVPPRGAEIVLGIFIGGPLFFAARLSTLGQDPGELLGGSLRPVLDRINDPTGGTPWRVLGVVLVSAIVTGLLSFAARYALRNGGTRAAIVCAVPVAAFFIVSVGFARSRLLTSAQLLPSLLGDPFGKGWDLLGTWGTPVDPNPLGTTGRIVLESSLVFLGHLIGAYLVQRSVPQRARLGAGVFLSVSLVAGIVAVSAA